MAHEIAFGDGIERREGHHGRVQTTLRQESLHPGRVEFHKRLCSRHANLFGINPAKSFASFDEMPQVTRSCRRTHAAECFDGLDAKVVGSFGQKLSLRQPQKL